MACKYINNNGAPYASQYVNFALQINNLNPYIPYPRLFSPRIPIPRFFTPQYPISQMCVTPPPHLLVGQVRSVMHACTQIILNVWS